MRVWVCFILLANLALGETVVRDLDACADLLAFREGILTPDDLRQSQGLFSKYGSNPHAYSVRQFQKVVARFGASVRFDRSGRWRVNWHQLEEDSLIPDADDRRLLNKIFRKSRDVFQEIDPEAFERMKSLDTPLVAFIAEYRVPPGTRTRPLLSWHKDGGIFNGLLVTEFSHEVGGGYAHIKNPRKRRYSALRLDENSLLGFQDQRAKHRFGSVNNQTKRTFVRRILVLNWGEGT